MYINLLHFFQDSFLFRMFPECIVYKLYLIDLDWFTALCKLWFAVIFETHPRAVGVSNIYYEYSLVLQLNNSKLVNTQSEACWEIQIWSIKGAHQNGWYWIEFCQIRGLYFQCDILREFYANWTNVKNEVILGIFISCSCLVLQ